VIGRDRHRRDLGVIWMGGRCVNTEPVRQGWAWHNQQQAASPALAAAQQEARQAGRCLWAEPGPTPPWQSRATNIAKAAGRQQAGKRGLRADYHRSYKHGHKSFCTRSS